MWVGQFRRQRPAKGLGLGDTFGCQRRILAALQALLCVPDGLAVAHEVDHAPLLHRMALDDLLHGQRFIQCC